MKAGSGLGTVWRGSLHIAQGKQLERKEEKLVKRRNDHGGETNIRNTGSVG